MKVYPILLSIVLLALSACVQGEAVCDVKLAPVLALKPCNEAATIEMKVEKSEKVKAVVLELEATGSLKDLKSCSLEIDGSQFAVKPLDLQSGEARVSIPLELQVDTTATITLGLMTKDEVDLDNIIEIKKVGVKTSHGTIPAEITGSPRLRLGVALRQRGQDGCDNCRIPGLVTTTKGSLIAIYDARYERNSDLQGDIDICYNRSTDGGKTWSPMSKILDMGEWGGLPEKYNGVSDPSITVDALTGDLYVAGTWMYGILDPKTGRFVEGLTKDSKEWNHQWREHGSQPGYGVKQSSQMIIAKSTDDGLTWSDPVNITRQVKPEKWWLMTTSPGAGITLSDGTIVIPAQGRDETGMAISTLISSKDRGRSWSAGNRITEAVPCNECMCVELPDGSIMLNCRSTVNRGLKEGNGRIIGTTTDLGKTWTEHPTSRKALIEPTCMASILRHDYLRADGQKVPTLFFFNPNDIKERIHHTLKCSVDNGETWPEDLWLELDACKGAGYSCMAMLDNETLGVVYEGSGACLVFQRVKLVTDENGRVKGYVR